ncbi:hypothetical protein [Flavobacterium rhizosphaerae]|uniref:Uncharacterized protein n=1 Tax=Flavobacterium rhizosphaerae TaxID=3163298 RepID=A0ABW8YTZ9_9FLAO
MEIKLKKGIGNLLFGMKEEDVKGFMNTAPDKKYQDEDGNVIYLYNSDKLRLTFYKDEDYRLGYIITSKPDVLLFGEKIIGRNWDTVTPLLKKHGIKSFETDTIDTVETYFSEENWVVFQLEFGEIIKVEYGAMINSKDEFIWHY